MAAQRVLCPTSATWLGRHMVTDRRWTLTTLDGAVVTLCSAACTVSWLCHALPADLVASDFELEPIADTGPRRDARNESEAAA